MIPKALKGRWSFRTINRQSHNPEPNAQDSAMEGLKLGPHNLPGCFAFQLPLTYFLLIIWIRQVLID